MRGAGSINHGYLDVLKTLRDPHVPLKVKLYRKRKWLDGKVIGPN